MKRFLIFTIRIEFPALDAVVAYLDSQAAQQSEIDALTAQVGDLTKQLNQSGMALEGAESQPKT